MTEHLLSQGREAYERRAWGEAHRRLAAADERDSLSAEDLDRLAAAAYLTGQVAGAAETWERAHLAFLAAGDAPQAVRCAFWLGLTLLERGEQVRGGGWLARADALLADPDLDCVERGYLRIPAALQALDGGEPARAHTEFGRIVAIADRFADSDLRTLGQLGRGQALLLQGSIGAGTRLLDEAMLAVTTGEVSVIAAGIIYCGAIVACRKVHDLRRAQEWTAALTRWCASQPDLQPYRGQCLVHRSEIMQWHGEWADALDEVRRACEHLTDPPGDPVIGMAFYQRAELLRLTGEFAEAEQAYRRASHWGHPVQPGLALLRLAQGRLEAADGAIQRAVAEATGGVDRSGLLAAYVEIKLAIGATSAARAGADELMEIAETLDSPYLRALATSADGAVLLSEGAPTEAGVTLRRGSQAWQELGAPYQVARTRVLLGLAYMRLGDNDTAELEWETAAGILRRLGAVPDLDRLSRLRMPAGPGPLTRREAEVLVLVAAGKTNREIAADLVLSEHTVRRHLQNIFGKLHLTSRAAATAYAYRHGLV